MKILKLEFENLNSLHGKWEINFESPEFQAEGMFAIVGPTGAGKTTLLDAICLALYGRTPRQGSVNQNQNEIMSRGTWHSTAAVTFQINAGIFKSTWTQQRAHKKPNGNLRPAKHNIAKIGKEKLVASGLQQTSKKIITLLGMDFEQFSKTMLLAQGQFEKLLHAKSKDHAAILEQITGTQFYSDFSKYVYEKEKEEGAAFQNLQAILDAIQLLSPEEENEAKGSLQENQKTVEKTNAEIQNTQQKIRWIEEIDKSKNEIDKNNNEIKSNLKTLKSISKEKNLTEEEEKKEKNKLQNLKDKQKEDAPLLLQVRKLDFQIQEKNKDLKTKKEDISTLKNQSDESNLSISSFETTQEEKSIQLNKVKTWIEENQSDENLVEQLSGLLFQIDEDLKSQQNILRNFKKLPKHSKEKAVSIDHIEDALQTTQKALLEIIEKQSEEKMRLLDGTQLPNLEEKLELLQTQLQLEKTIASLETHRNDLEDGKPCPLCGSERHPFAEGNLSKPNETQAKIDQLKRTIAQIDFIEKETHEFSEAKKSILSLIDEYQGWKDQNATLHQSIKPFSIDKKVFENPEELKNVLRLKKSTWQQNLQNKTKIEEQIKEIKSKIENLQAKVENDQTLLSKLETERDKLEEELKSLTKKRQEHFGDKNPDTEEQTLASKITSAENARDKITANLQQLNSLWTECNTRIEDLRKANQEKNITLGKLKTKLLNALKQEPSNKIESVDFDSLLSELNTSLESLENKRDASNEIIGSLRQKLETHNENKAIQSEQQKALDEQKAIWNRWSKLSKLIGSANGQKYRDFVQQITFETLLAHANQELQKLSDRYLLIRPSSADSVETKNEKKDNTEEAGLQIHVIDLYQSGQIRASNNLSGGESFLVSLALALGLSRMASKNMRIDSLFLDEGFGTLDEETLHKALEALSKLQQSGKIIGMISHRRELQERIPLKIQVTPVGNRGKSIVEGPGCRKIINKQKP